MKTAIVKGEHGLYGLQERDHKFYSSETIHSVNEIFTGSIKFNMESDKNFTNVKLEIPVQPSKILCPALNFKSHSSETKQENPKFPYFFPKFENAIIPWNERIKCHSDIQKLDYEGEIAAIIGKKAYGIPKEDASQYIGGYAVVNDVSARDFQAQYAVNLGKNWIMSKAADTFLPISSTVFLGEYEKFNIKTEVNGQVRQNSDTDDMIFSFPDMVSYLSQHITLLPGDMILSGTPEGVAASGKYPFLKHNDIVKISSDKIGMIENIID